MNEIQEKIAKLYEGGYSSNDIYDVLVYSGLSSDEVANSMASFYDQRAKQEQEAMQKQREELEERYNVLAGQGYGLKKKDSDGEDLPLESSGEYPETQADPLSWSLRNNDEKLLKANSDLNHINSMLASIGAYSTYGSQSFQNDEAINRAYQDLVDSGFRIEGYGEDYVFDVEDSEDIKQKLRELKKAKRADLNRSVEQMNALNKSMGVETNYSVDERNPSSFAEAQKMALMRMRRDEELLRQAVPEYVNEDWDRYQEDMAEARAEAMEANGLGYIARGLGNVYMNANLSFQQTKANWWGDEDAVSELRYHQDMMNNKRQMEKAEIKKKAYSSEERANMNYSEVFANVMAKTMRGEMDLDDFSDLVLGTAVEVPDVASQFVYWGGQAMAGPLGWASIAGQVASMKNADLIADRPDLSSFERGALAITAGIVEGAANAIFSGAEKALSQGIRSMGIKGQIQNAKNSFLNSGKSKFIKDYAKGYISEGFEEGFVELMDYATLAAVDIAAGRRAEDVNPYEFLDAFMLGGLGGGIGPSFQHATSNLGHNKTFAQKMGIHNAIREVEAKYNNAEFGSVEKTRLREVLANLRAEYKSLTEAEGKAYEDFSPADKRSLQKINQELSYLRDMIRAKRDGAGIKLNKDQVAELKKRFDEGWAEKTRIENKYASPESATAKKAQEEVVEVEDVNETPSPAVEKIIDSEEIKTQKQEAIQAQEADDLVKEGNQLSLFDETQAQDQVAEAVAEESTEAETDVEEVVATEETPVAEEAPVVDETKEGVFAEAINAGEGFNLSDRTKVGEGKGKVSIEFANTFNKIREGFALNLPKTGVGALVYDRANFDQIIESRANEKLRERFVEYRAQNGKGPVMGLYDVETNNIILPNDARAEDIREEFAHAMFLPIVNGNANPRVQEKLYQDLVALNERVKDKGFSDYMSKREADYRAAGVSETKLREEMIVGFLNYYKNNPSVFKSVAGRIRQIINSAFKAFGQKGPLVLQTDTDLMNLAEAFTAASEGRRVDVAATKQEFQEAQRRAGRKITAEELKKKPGESDEDFRKRIDDLTTEITGMETPETIEAREADKREGLSFSLKEGRKQFNYLKDTEVFYTEHPFATKENPPVSSGTYSSKRNQKSIRVNDYFHFRNWYNKQTGNQEVTRITDMFFIKDGKVYNVKPPKPKVDKQGNKVTMPVPPTPRFRKMQSQFASDKEANELKKEASRILAEGNNVFKNLPWSGYVSAKMFEPSLPDGVGFSDLSPSDRVSFSQIYRENLIMADRMNLSPDEIADIIEEQTGVKPSPATDIYPFKRFPSGVKIDPALRPDIFQPTGKTMVDENGESAPGYTASYSFLNGFSKNVQPQGRVDFRQFPDRPKGNISDLRGLVFAIGGFDQTRSTPANGIFSGTNSLDYQVEGLNVVTSVIDRHTAKALERFYKQQAEADYKRRVDSGIIKQGDTHLGKLGYGFSVLKPEATFGNPDVFYKTMSDIFDHIAKQENPLVEANRFFSTLTESAREISRRLIEDSVVARYPDGTYKEISPGLARAMSESDGDLRKVEFENIEQVKEAVYMIAFSKNQKNIHKAADQQTVVKRSFEARKEFFKTDFLRYYLETKGDYSFKGFKKPQLASAFLQDFNDPIFLGRPDGVLDAYRTFEYKFENGKFTTPFAYVDSAKGFEGVLVSELPVSEVKYMEDLYGIEDIDPAMKVTVGKEGKRKRYKDREGNIRSRTVVVDVKKQIGELPREEAKKKIKDLNSYSNLVLGAETGGTTILPFHNNDSFSIEPGLFDAKTDQGTFKMRELTGFQRWKNLWVRRLVDKYNDIFDIQRAIENQIGKIDKSMDFQMKEELMYGKAAEALKKLDDKIDGIKKAMKDKKVSLEDLNDYLYAKHVVERNAVIKERIEEENEKRAKQKKKLLPVTESGSGKSNAWAEETLGRFDQAKLRDLEDIETLTREIQDNTRDTYVEFGLESQETIDAWNAMFDNYVPLAGIAVDEEAGVTSSYPTGGAGISVFGPMTKRAKGRKSAAENILAQVIAQNAAAQVKARTNEAVRALYDLAEANPNAEVWQVMDEANSIDPHVVSVRVDGKQKFIRFKDASYAESLRGMNLPETNLLVKILRAPSNWLRRSFTTLNPEFVVSNFARDIQTAVFNAAAEAEIEGGILNGEKVMGDIIKTVPQALRQLTAKQIGRGKNDLIDRYYEDFKEDGAKTGWAYAKRLNDIVKELEDEASETTRTQEILGVGKNIVDFVEGMNEAFEDSVRLASYIAARKNGVSREKAAQLAKNITVNFNKHGEWGQALNGVYLFFNASVQGTARMFRTLGKLKPVARPDGTNREWYERANTAQIMAGGLMLFSGMISMMNAGMSDEDEDGVLFYDKIPDYVKERNLIIMNPRDGKTYYKIPLPYGFNIFSNVGTVAADVSRGGMDADKGMYFLANGLVNAFSPINFGQSESFGRSIAKGGIPTVAKPFFDAWGFNETYFGGPVAAEQLPFGVKRPESSMSFRSPEAVKGWFSYLNEITGGSERVSGVADINPDRMWYVFEYFIGGAGNFVNRTGKTIRSVQGKFKDSDYDIAVNDIPFARIMYGEQSKYYDHGKYRDNETKVKQLFLERKDSKDYKNPRYEGIVKLNNKLKLTEKKLKKLRKERDKAREMKDWVKRSVEIQRIMDEERKVIMEFNKMYDELRK